MVVAPITMGAIPVIIQGITQGIILGTRLGMATLTGIMYGMDPLILATAGMAGGDTALGAGVGAPLGATTAIPTMLGIVVTTKVL